MKIGYLLLLTMYFLRFYWKKMLKLSCVRKRYEYDKGDWPRSCVIALNSILK